MNVGALRHLVTLENPGAAVPDLDGGYTQTWMPLSPSQVWASINPATARDLERLVASTVQSTASHVIEMWYHAGVNTKTRITYGTRVFQVTGVQNPEERNIELRIAAEEVVT